MVLADAVDVASYQVVGVNNGFLKGGGAAAKTGISVLLPLIVAPVVGSVARCGALAELAAPESGTLGSARSGNTCVDSFSPRCRSSKLHGSHQFGILS